jgi:hypothetical protein
VHPALAGVDSAGRANEAGEGDEPGGGFGGEAMTPREQQLVDAIKAHKAYTYEVWGGAMTRGDIALWSVLDSEPEQERTCETCQSDNTASTMGPCGACTNRNRWTPKFLHAKPPATEPKPPHDLTTFKSDVLNYLERIAVALERK